MSLENSLNIPPDVSSDDAQKINSLSATVKSWFCRYYDHLISLVLINVIWFLFCLCLTYGLVHFAIIFKTGRWNVWGTVGICFWDIGITILTARAVFLLLNAELLSWETFGENLGKIWLKAFGLFLIWAGLLGLAAYNFYFYTHWHPLGEAEKWILSGVLIWFFVFWASCFFYLWPILFFQNPPFFRVFYKAFLLVFANQFVLFLGLLLFLAVFLLFSLVPAGWILFGFVFFFSIQCMLLEKHFLKYRIIYKDRSYETFLGFLIRENQRDWKYFLRPWENK
jgi:hypothetical protein